MGAAAKLQTFEEMMAAIAALPEGEHREILGPGEWRTRHAPLPPFALAIAVEALFAPPPGRVG